MGSASASVVSSVLPASCNEGCPFAEPMHGDYEDWVWCTRPEAACRVQRVGADCPGFAQASRCDLADQPATRRQV